MTEKPVFILEKLKEAGFEAYFVGGCVRDTLLGRPVHDWDITTSAMPERTMQVFPKCVATGLKHGTVTVVQDGEMYEVTTFRSDGTYLDGRHPENVTFVRDLREDLSRRDFTVNAMAMDEKGNITDLFGGREDLKNSILRCVGEPEKRFREDALRMLRALRFSAQLGFEIEKNTYEAICRCADLCAGLSCERVREEMEKTLLSGCPEKVGEMAKLGLLKPVKITETEELRNIGTLPAERTVRWATFFKGCRQAEWEALRLDRKTGVIAKNSAAVSGSAKGRQAWKELISRWGEDVGLCAAVLDGETELAEEILSSGECLFLKDLAVSGGDFPYLHGKEVGALLEHLLQHVLRHPEDNVRQVLLELARKM